MRITISREDGTNIVIDKDVDVEDKPKVDPEKSVEQKDEPCETKKVSKENLSLIDSIFAKNLK